MRAPSRARLASRNPIGDIYGTTLVLLLPLAFAAIALSPPDAALADWFNGTAPLYLITVMAISGYRVTRALPSALWSPAFWLPVTTAIFFGFGPLVEIYGNYETKLRLTVQKIAISETELFAANHLSFICTLGVVTGFWLHTRLRPRIWQRVLSARQATECPVFAPETLATVFIVAGMVFVHAIVNPSQWGMLNIVVPGALTSIGGIVDVGFALAAFLAVKGATRMRWLLLLLWPLHLFLVTLSFAKSAIVIALALPAIGAYLGHRRIVLLVASFAGIMAVYSISQSYVHYGRGEILKKTETIWNAGYGERIRILEQYLSEEVATDDGYDDGEETEGWWLRLNYSNVQAVAMRFREQGILIDSLSGAWTLFIPRVLWPDKPIYEGPGQQFYRLLTGNEGTAVGLSVYGDVFWQFGWAGVAILMPMIGWMYAMMAWRSIEAVEQRNFIRMPLVLLSILTAASGLTKFFVNGIIAVIPIYVCYVLLVRGIEWFVRSQKRMHRASIAHPGRVP